MNISPLNVVLLTVIGLLGVGMYGLLITRNLIKIVLVLQILVKSAMLALVLAGKIAANLGLGQSLATTVIVADTVVAVVGLALAVQVRRRFGTLDVTRISTLRGSDGRYPFILFDRFTLAWRHARLADRCWFAG